ncbi:hypothetical protein TorRG33x02_230890 [Trema orientale]|uniref:Secreted protein n=1 Tax=Trema orientale TaxID=63057 RepID=A0A2P5E6M0_TREOI|nr:hypothetical protein TorRG33x02_230890 [Trema orientale]
MAEIFCRRKTTILLTFRIVLLIIQLIDVVKGNTHSDYSFFLISISPTTVDKFKTPHPHKDDPIFRCNTCILSHFIMTCLEQLAHPINFGECARDVSTYYL